MITDNSHNLIFL